MAYWLHDAPTV